MIFVTGGTGLLGAHLLYYLSRAGYKILALKRKSSNIVELERTFDLLVNIHSENGIPTNQLLKNIEWIDGDILDIYSLQDAFSKNIDQVYHCAGFVSYDSIHKEKLLKINVQGTANIVNACLEHNIPKLGYVSSIAALSRTKNGEAINESNDWKESPLNTNYAISKYNGELEVWRGVAEGLDAIIINPSVILGFGNWTNSSNIIIQKAWQEFRFYTEGINGFVDGRDVAKCMIQLMESEIVNERFIITEGNYTTKYILQSFAENLHKQKPSIKVNKLIAEFGWRMIAIRDYFKETKSIFTKEAARAAFYKSSYSNEKVSSAINYQFTPMPQTIREISLGLLNYQNQWEEIKASAKVRSSG
ncbi:MAG: NAD-dependent epimerase/dehydratase family protein [Bacteroidia bacterium]|nr:NAD-dependent epimerase/dehydratase family protein [Bacteroidia bacterium]